jgi:hypothetical protein
MRLRSTLLTAALAGALALVGCGEESSGDTRQTGRAASADGTDVATPEPAGTAIPDDFPLSAGMGGPGDTIPTSRTGPGLRDLTLCGTAPLRGLGIRDRLVADNSGGESANTRELVLLGNPDEAALVAQSFADLPLTCPTVDAERDQETLTEVRDSPFGRAPATTLVRTYTFGGEAGTGATIIHVVPVGAAVLVTSTYGEWSDHDVQRGIGATVDPLRETVAALAMFGDDDTPATSPEPSASATDATPVTTR